MASCGRASTVLGCLPFCVDTWTSGSSVTGKPHFLTHAHKDHTEGIETISVDVYCTYLTRRLLLLRLPDAAGKLRGGDEAVAAEGGGRGGGSRFHTLELGVRTEVSHGGVSFSVTALDANHCPGAAMLLFQGCFGNILHTGDCRFNLDVVRSVQEALGGRTGEGKGGDIGWGRDCEGGEGERDGGSGGIGGGGGGCERLDLLYLDCTFADLPLDFPSRQDAVRHAEQLIRRWPSLGGGGGSTSTCSYGRPLGGSAPPGGAFLPSSSSLPSSFPPPSAAPGPPGQLLRRVFLSADTLGTEPLLAMAAEAFGQPLYVPPPERHKEYGFDNASLVRERRDALAALLPHVALSDDPACVFHLCGIRNFAHRGTGASKGAGSRKGAKRQAPDVDEEGRGGGVGGGGGEAGWLPPVVAALQAEQEGGGGSGGVAGGGRNIGGGGGGCLFIRGSTQAFGKRVRDQYDRPGQLLSVRNAAPAPTAATQERAVHYVLYSQHSSRSELVAALAALRPRATRPINAEQVGCMATVVAERAGSERPEDVEAEIAARMAWAAEVEAEADDGVREGAGMEEGPKAGSAGGDSGASATGQPAVPPTVPLWGGLGGHTATSAGVEHVTTPAAAAAIGSLPGPGDCSGRGNDCSGRGGAALWCGHTQPGGGQGPGRDSLGVAPRLAPHIQAAGLPCGGATAASQGGCGAATCSSALPLAQPPPLSGGAGAAVGLLLRRGQGAAHTAGLIAALAAAEADVAAEATRSQAGVSSRPPRTAMLAGLFGAPPLPPPPQLQQQQRAAHIGGGRDGAGGCAGAAQAGASHKALPLLQRPLSPPPCVATLRGLLQLEATRERRQRAEGWGAPAVAVTCDSSEGGLLLPGALDKAEEWTRVPEPSPRRQPLQLVQSSPPPPPQQREAEQQSQQEQAKQAGTPNHSLGAQPRHRQPLLSKLLDSPASPPPPPPPPVLAMRPPSDARCGGGGGRVAAAGSGGSSRGRGRGAGGDGGGDGGGCKRSRVSGFTGIFSRHDSPEPQPQPQPSLLAAEGRGATDHHGRQPDEEGSPGPILSAAAPAAGGMPLEVAVGAWSLAGCCGDEGDAKRPRPAPPPPTQCGFLASLLASSDEEDE